MKGYHFKRLLALVMAFVMFLNLGMPNVSATTVSDTDSDTFSYEKLDADEVSVETVNTTEQMQENDSEFSYEDSDEVRVMIVLEKEPAISLVEDTEEDIAENAEIQEYREQLKKAQQKMANRISKEALGGDELAVEWNLTLVTNAISATVEYGQIEAISEINGVKAVYMEQRHLPMTAADTNNVVAQEMTGAATVKQESGYTGAGTRVSVVDTGTDTDHQSFSAAAYEYSLAQQAAKKNMSYEEYVASLNLLTKEKVAEVLTSLNCYTKYASAEPETEITPEDGTEPGTEITPEDGTEPGTGITPEDGTETTRELTVDDVYLNAKQPFAFNYVDNNLDVTHDNDDQGEHGSHVAGITTANTYIPSGDTYVSAAEAVGVTGVAPDAQLLTMKVFGANGGAYTSDYMAAVEDSILLGCEVVNLSLGSANPGFVVEHTDEGEETAEYVNGLMESIVSTGTVMSVAAGNAGSWADEDDAFQLMYTDETGTATHGEPSTFGNSLAVASVDNVGAVTTYQNTFKNTKEGEEYKEYSTIIEEVTGGVNEKWNTLDPNGEGTEYDVVFLGNPRNLLTGGTQIQNAIYGGSVSDFGNKGYYEDKIVLVARGNEVYFSDKHANAAAAGAAAVIIYNNESGSLSASIEGSEATVPCAGISLEQAKEIFALCTMSKDTNYLYTAKVTVKSGLNVEHGEDVEYPTMSDFSSWGPTGALTMKPEITAPGGGIYSVNGALPETNGYESMSGTSMATPHITGLVALATQYLREEDVFHKVQNIFDDIALTQRTLVQSLLMSTAKPLIEESSGVEYSVRNQGSGLADIMNVINAESFIMVDGQPDGKVKAELGDGGENGWSFTFDINNMTDAELTYDLSASILTTDTEIRTEGNISGDTYDYNNDGSFNENDIQALLDYAVKGIEISNEETADVNADGTVTAYDAYLLFEILEQHAAATHYLTAKQMKELGAEVTYTGAKVTDNKVTVDANASATVTVDIKVTEEAVAEMRELGYTNGFYVEGFVYATPETTEEGVVGVTHSIPLLGWYGNWTDPSMYDIGSYIERIYGIAERPSHLNADIKNVLTWCPKGDNTGYYYTGNIYGAYNSSTGELIGDQRYIEDRNAISSVDNMWSLYAIFPTPIRTVGDFMVQVRDADTGEVYFEDDYESYDDFMIPSFYYDAYQQWYDVTSEYGVGIEWNYTDKEGNPLAEGTNIEVCLVVAPEYYIDGKNEDGSDIVRWDELGKGATLAYQFTIDNTDPDLTDSENALKIEGGDLRFEVQDNNYVAAVILMNGAGTEIAEYYYPDMDTKNGVAAGSFDIVSFRAKYGNKATVAICDYAGNETYYAVNLGGEGKKYGDLVGFQYDPDYGVNTWVSFFDNVNQNETAICIADREIVAAEYVNGFVFAQTTDGSLYGFAYADMLADTVDFDDSLITRLEYVYQDFAFNYADGQLYGLTVDEFEGTKSTVIYSISLEAGLDGTYAESWTAERNNIEGLTLACDDDGTFYVLATETDAETGEDSSAMLWKVAYSEEYYGYMFENVGDTGLAMNYLQSMTWDHNTETLYWARFYPEGWMSLSSELLVVNPQSGKCTEAGTLSGEVAGLFAPLTSKAAAKEAHQNVPKLDASIVGTPMLSATNLSMNVGATNALICTFDPWYTSAKEVTWETSDDKVATVDENGVVTAVGTGSCTITVTSKADTSLSATCNINVASLSLTIEGITSVTDGGIGTTGGSYMYEYQMTEGIADMKLGNPITAPEEMDFGLNIASSVEGRNETIWACEWGNTGMIYQMSKEGEVQQVLQPVNGDMMFGMAYSEANDSFTGIMNYWLFVDQPLTEEASGEMMDSFQEGVGFTWHKFDMSEYLNASQGNLVTKEDGYTNIVFSAITNIDNKDGEFVEDTYKDYTGNWDQSGSGGVRYTPTNTLVLLDNVGRLWYIDETSGLIKNEDEYGNFVYVKEGESLEDLTSTYIDPLRKGIFAQGYDTDEDGTEDTYSVFVIREIKETAMYDMFLNGTMPAITYSFSDLHYVEDEATGTPMFFISMYDYFNEGKTNQLYLYIPGEPGDEWEGIEGTPDILYDLGTTGVGNIISTINSAEVTGGLELGSSENAGEDTGETDGVATIYKGRYME